MHHGPMSFWGRAYRNGQAPDRTKHVIKMMDRLEPCKHVHGGLGRDSRYRTGNNRAVLLLPGFQDSLYDVHNVMLKLISELLHGACYRCQKIAQNVAGARWIEPSISLKRADDSICNVITDRILRCVSCRRNTCRRKVNYCSRQPVINLIFRPLDCRALPFLPGLLGGSATPGPRFLESGPQS